MTTNNELMKLIEFWDSKEASEKKCEAMACYLQLAAKRGLKYLELLQGCSYVPDGKISNLHTSKEGTLVQVSRETKRRVFVGEVFGDSDFIHERMLDKDSLCMMTNSNNHIHFRAVN